MSLSTKRVEGKVTHKDVFVNRSFQRFWETNIHTSKHSATIPCIYGKRTLVSLVLTR